SLSIFTRARLGMRTVKSMRFCAVRSRTAISLPEMLTSRGSTGAPDELACKLALSFSPSEAITVTRPVRFLIVKSVLALTVNSFSYAWARDGFGVSETKRLAATSNEIGLKICRDNLREETKR